MLYIPWKSEHFRNDEIQMGKNRKMNNDKKCYHDLDRLPRITKHRQKYFSMPYGNKSKTIKGPVRRKNSRITQF